ncbi:unnamed protein product [Paramecium octaurelia]|uniref:Uncharacterized protein n=1 Tax=Paramecium octaurelia TaxID=43137 RepID=A0A8S1U4A8_PAROT|nr:unnamed protein product [Paramecium octaurelia]
MNPMQFNPPRSTITSQVTPPGPNFPNNGGFTSIQSKNQFQISNQSQPPPIMPIHGLNSMPMGNQAQNSIFKTQDMNQKEKEEMIHQLNIVVRDAKQRQEDIKKHYQKIYD